MESWPPRLRAMVPAATWATHVRRAAAAGGPGSLLVRAFDAVESQALAMLADEAGDTERRHAATVAELQATIAQLRASLGEAPA